MKLDNRDDVVRAFWAMFLGSKVRKDGQVPGFRVAWNRMSPWAQAQADLYADACWTKIARDHREPDECIASGVRALRDVLRDELPEQPTTRPDLESVRNLVRSVMRGLGEPSDLDPARPHPSADEQIKAIKSAPRLDETWPGWNNA